MRCPDCNTFVPYNTEEEPEETAEPEINGNRFTVSYRRMLSCENCGTELKETDLELEFEIQQFDGLPDDKNPDKCTDESGHEWDFSQLEVTPSTGAIDTDRKGKKITNPRYIKTTYGVEVTGAAVCEHCHAAAHIQAEGSQIASGFDELT